MNRGSVLKTPQMVQKITRRGDNGGGCCGERSRDAISFSTLSILGASPFPSSSIRFADIIFGEVLDPNGQNPKTRRVVVLTPDNELAAGSPIVVAGVTGTLPNPLTADYVRLPYTLFISHSVRDLR